MAVTPRLAMRSAARVVTRMSFRSFLIAYQNPSNVTTNYSSGAPGTGGNGGSAYSGAGGNAAGGNVVHNGDEGLELISLFSSKCCFVISSYRHKLTINVPDNAGNGGKATSGDAFAGNGGDNQA